MIPNSGTIRKKRSGRRFQPSPGALLIALLVFAAVRPESARANWVPQSFIFDRMVFSPDGKSLGVIGRYFNRLTGESFEDTLLVDPASGKVTCVSPSVLDIVLSRDGSRVLYRGRWGLYDHDLKSGATRQLLYQHPMQPLQIIEFSYNREITDAVVVRCNDWDPGVNGVYRYPLDGSDPIRDVADEGCGPRVHNYFQAHNRGLMKLRRELPGENHAINPPCFPGTIWRVGSGEEMGVAVWANGPAGSDTLCNPCRAEVVSWPDTCGPIVMGTGPDNIKDTMSSGGIWLIRPNREPTLLLEDRIDGVVWADSTHAFAFTRTAKLEEIDAADATIRQLSLSMVPAWLRDRTLPPPQVWTVRLDGEIHGGADSLMAAAREVWLAAGERKTGAYSFVRQADPKTFVLTTGAFTDSAAASRFAAKIRAAHVRGGRITAFVPIRRPITDMLGDFEFGSITSPDKKWRAWFRTHPHLMQPYMSTELWVETKGSRPRPVLEGMATF